MIDYIKTDLEVFVFMIKSNPVPFRWLRRRQISRPRFFDPSTITCPMPSHKKSKSKHLEKVEKVKNFKQNEYIC